jgi:serine protease Do
VGIVHLSYHPNVATYIRSLDDWKKDSNAEKYLNGTFGSGFIYVDASGANYIITNHHVIRHGVSFSITFEKTDGAKTTYDNLRVVAADDNIDIAILAFENDVKPFTRGLAFASSPVQEGTAVYSAGFPGLVGIEGIWQFGSGVVSNARVKFSPDDFGGDADDAKLGPYIQHTAQVDSGNSGGPLLVAAPGSPAGYEVVGINTMSAIRRQAANFAIPTNRALAFIDAVFAPHVPKDSEALAASERASLEKRLDVFMAMLNDDKVPKYVRIAPYLTTDCVGRNAVYAVNLARVRQNIGGTFNRDPIGYMTNAASYLIEESLRKKPRSKDAKVSLDSMTKTDSGYTVTFRTRSGETVNSLWVQEYGLWHIETFGDTLTGDQSRVTSSSKVPGVVEDYFASTLFSVGGGVIQTGDTSIFDENFSGYDVRFEVQAVSGFIYGGVGSFLQFSRDYSGVFLNLDLGVIAAYPFASSIWGVYGGGVISGGFGYFDDFPLAFRAGYEAGVLLGWAKVGYTWLGGIGGQPDVKSLTVSVIFRGN